MSVCKICTQFGDCRFISSNKVFVNLSSELHVGVLFDLFNVSNLLEQLNQCNAGHISRNLIEKNIFQFVVLVQFIQNTVIVIVTVPKEFRVQ